MTSSQLIARWCLFAGVCIGETTPAGAQALNADQEAGRAQVQAERTRELARVVSQLAKVSQLQQGRGAPAAIRIPTPSVAGSDPLSGPVVRHAPYSGDASTTVIQILGDGTRIEQGTTARFYRDSAGRVRREQTVIGLASLNPSGDTQTVTTIDPDPDDNFAYQLNTTARTANRIPRGMAALLLSTNTRFYVAGTTISGLRTGPETPRDSSPTEQSLGTRQIEGVKATGRKTTTVIPTGQIGNDRPIEITEERWESPELQVLLYSRFSDPRSGVVEYRLTNINRSEPPPDLFMVPPDYTVVETGGRRSGGAGGRGDPNGGRGGRQ
jgi:hypothetical protein